MTYNKEEQIEIANTIIKQMGGFGKLRAMIGMKDAVALESGVQFAFKGSRKANKCQVEYRADDLYNLRIFRMPALPRMGGGNLDAYFKRLDQASKPVYEVEGVYWDQLKPIFEKETGLYLSL